MITIPLISNILRYVEPIPATRQFGCPGNQDTTIVLSPLPEHRRISEKGGDNRGEGLLERSNQGEGLLEERSNQRGEVIGVIRGEGFIQGSGYLFQRFFHFHPKQRGSLP